jgi:hypothetical protein
LGEGFVGAVWLQWVRAFVLASLLHRVMRVSLAGLQWHAFVEILLPRVLQLYFEDAFSMSIDVGFDLR